MSNCCYKCERRTMTCHSTCEDYKAFKKKHDEDMAKKRKDKNIENIVCDYACEQKTKYLKKYRKDVRGKKYEM